MHTIVHKYTPSMHAQTRYLFLNSKVQIKLNQFELEIAGDFSKYKIWYLCTKVTHLNGYIYVFN